MVLKEVYVGVHSLHMGRGLIINWEKLDADCLLNNLLSILGAIHSW